VFTELSTINSRKSGLLFVVVVVVVAYLCTFEQGKLRKYLCGGANLKSREKCTSSDTVGNVGYEGPERRIVFVVKLGISLGLFAFPSNSPGIDTSH
jgi:hypothetical protein